MISSVSTVIRLTGSAWESWLKMQELKGYYEARFRHCYGVGRKMYEYAKNVYGWDENHCREMYILGILHDQGYEFETSELKHDALLSSMLATYPYRNEIRYHNKYQSHYDTPEMRLMYYADCTVDGWGNSCTYEERLEDLKRRHGENSEAYLETVELIDHLKEWGFKD